MAVLADTGIEPVGEVMGCLVSHLGWGGYGCGVYTGFGGSWASPGTISSGAGGRGGYAPYVDALYGAYDGALRRCLLEAQALGADGVVGVQWTQRPVGDGGNREFVALGTAVRARSTVRPANLFATDLSGQDVVKALRGGWVPTGLVAGIAVAVRHDDYYTRRQATATWSGANYEIPGYTELVSHVRADARSQFARRAARHGGDAAVVSSMSLNVYELEVAENHRDHIAQSLVIGTCLARVSSRAPRTGALTVMPLTSTPRRSR
jgi:uncharacterized protein YbjQ (UPF0145 family)